MTELHASIRHLEMPRRMRSLPLTENGFPQLWFAEIVDGKPDLRVMSATKFITAITKKLCWLCGQPLGRNFAFVLGPMCTITRTTQEPPCHLDCAQYAVKACPFLARPTMHRREAGHKQPVVMSGYAIERNPGVAAIWTTRGYHAWNAPKGVSGVLITVHDPDNIEWYAEGRRATYEEVVAAIESGAPALYELAQNDPEPGAVEALNQQMAKFLPLLRDLEGREARRPAPEVEAAMIAARADEIAWFRLHPDEDAYIRPLDRNELPAELADLAEATHVRVAKLDQSGDLRQREFGRVVGGEFQPLLASDKLRSPKLMSGT